MDKYFENLPGWVSYVITPLNPHPVCIYGRNDDVEFAVELSIHIPKTYSRTSSDTTIILFFLRTTTHFKLRIKTTHLKLGTDI